MPFPLLLTHLCPRSPFLQLSQDTQPGHGVDGACKSSQHQDSPHSPPLPKERPQISSQGLPARAGAWHGSQLVKWCYPEPWARLSSLTPWDAGMALSHPLGTDLLLRTGWEKAFGGTQALSRSLQTGLWHMESPGFHSWRDAEPWGMRCCSAAGCERQECR